MDIQFIIDEYSCAAYKVKYVNKSIRGISHLHRQIVELQKHYPDDFNGLMKKLCINMINTVEMTCQEGAWYLLRQPMSQASRDVVFIPTMWPEERNKTYKKKNQMDQEHVAEDSRNIWNYNIIQKYEFRSISLEMVCLADFAAWYKPKPAKSNEYYWRKQVRIIRYVNYEMVTNISEYKREMVTLFLPFRCEHTQILDHLKCLHLFEQNNDVIMTNFATYFLLTLMKALIAGKNI